MAPGKRSGPIHPAPRIPRHQRCNRGSPPPSRAPPSLPRALPPIRIIPGGCAPVGISSPSSGLAPSSPPPPARSSPAPRYPHPSLVRLYCTTVLGRYRYIYILLKYTRAFCGFRPGGGKKREKKKEKHTRPYAQTTQPDPAKNDAVLCRNEARIDVFRFLGSAERAGALRVRMGSRPRKMRLLVPQIGQICLAQLHSVT